MLTSKKGISALQIQRMIGSAYRTAWYISHRLRAGMADPDFKKLMGIVEVDETFIRRQGQKPSLGQEVPCPRGSAPARSASSARSLAKGN